MMILLLDTHVLIWLMEGNQRLDLDVRKQIEETALHDAVVVSAMTPWEIGLLAAKKRLNLEMEPQEWVRTALSRPGIRLEPLSPPIAVASSWLPWEMHGDPADRILVATARHLGAALVTADEQLLKYGAEGNFRFLPAS